MSAPEAPAVPRRRRRWVLVAAIATASALVLAGGVVASVQLLAGPSEAQIREAEDRWGLSPDPDAEVDWQPDVVVLDHGALAVRSASDDGLSWTLDAGYPGVGELAEGDVLFLTNRIVGRIGALGHPDGGGVEVTLIPVDLPEIVREADLSFSQEISDAEFSTRTQAAYPGMVVDKLADTAEDAEGDELDGESPTPTPTPSSSETPDAAPAEGGTSVDPAAAITRLGDDDEDDGEGDDGDDPDEGDDGEDGEDQGEEPPSMFTDEGWQVEGKKFSISPWVVGFTASDSELGFTAYIQQGGLQGALKVRLRYQNLKIEGDARITGGAWSGSPTAVLSGITGFELAFGAGIGDSMDDNVNFLFEVPIEFEKSVVVGGVPLAFEAEFKFTFGTGLTAKESTLLARGVYTIDGEIGIRDGKPVTPTVSVEQPMIDSISTASIGIDQAIFGFNAKVGLGLGVAGISVGPFGSFTATAGVLRGTALTAPWGVPCQVTLVMNAGGGIGGKVGEHYLAALAKKLGLDEPPELEFDVVNQTKEIVNRTVDMPICPAQTSSTEAPRETPPVERRQQDNDPYTAAGARKVPGKGQQHSPRAEEPETGAVENPSSPNPDLTGDGTPEGPEPDPKPAGEDDDYSLDSDYCDLQPDPRHTETDIYGDPVYYYCADFEPPLPPPDDDTSDADERW
ncbi:hypothetical protein [Protaetiibacter intestinalis]|uniref:hypothetical protein n=1 Tax=Protaetiibacter intestinalis TaxID=2419774 RepID=UPI0013001C51|nr:hypothetical protein [Protaetiibacter intestinalis]